MSVEKEEKNEAIVRGGKRKTSLQYQSVLLWLLREYPHLKEFNPGELTTKLQTRFRLDNWTHHQIRQALTTDRVVYRPEGSRWNIVLDHERVKQIIEVRWGGVNS